MNQLQGYRVGALYAELALNISQYQRDIKSALSETKQMGEKLQEAVGTKPQKAIQGFVTTLEMAHESVAKIRTEASELVTLFDVLRAPEKVRKIDTQDMSEILRLAEAIPDTLDIALNIDIQDFMQKMDMASTKMQEVSFYTQSSVESMTQSYRQAASNASKFLEDFRTRAQEIHQSIARTKTNLKQLLSDLATEFTKFKTPVDALSASLDNMSKVRKRKFTFESNLLDDEVRQAIDSMGLLYQHLVNVGNLKFPEFKNLAQDLDTLNPKMRSLAGYFQLMVKHMPKAAMGLNAFANRLAGTVKASENAERYATNVQKLAWAFVNLDAVLDKMSAGYNVQLMPTQEDLTAWIGKFREVGEAIAKFAKWAPQKFKLFGDAVKEARSRIEKETPKMLAMFNNINTQLGTASDASVKLVESLNSLGKIRSRKFVFNTNLTEPEMKEAMAGIATLSHDLTELGKVGLPSFDKLGETLSGIATDLSNAMDSFDRFVEHSSEMQQQSEALAFSLIEVFEACNQAPVASQSLDDFSQSLESMSAYLKQVDMGVFGEAMSTSAMNLDLITQVLTEVENKFSSVLKNLMRYTAFMPSLFDRIVNALRGLWRAINSIGQVIRNISGEFVLLNQMVTGLLSALAMSPEAAKNIITVAENLGRVGAQLETLKGFELALALDFTQPKEEVTQFLEALDRTDDRFRKIIRGMRDGITSLREAFSGTLIPSINNTTQAIDSALHSVERLTEGLRRINEITFEARGKQVDIFEQMIQDFEPSGHLDKLLEELEQVEQVAVRVGQALNMHLVENADRGVTRILPAIEQLRQGFERITESAIGFGNAIKEATGSKARAGMVELDTRTKRFTRDLQLVVTELRKIGAEIQANLGTKFQVAIGQTKSFIDQLTQSLKELTPSVLLEEFSELQTQASTVGNAISNNIIMNIDSGVEQILPKIRELRTSLVALSADADTFGNRIRSTLDTAAKNVQTFNTQIQELSKNLASAMSQIEEMGGAIQVNLGMGPQTSIQQTYTAIMQLVEALRSITVGHDEITATIDDQTDKVIRSARKTEEALTDSAKKTRKSIRKESKGIEKDTEKTGKKIVTEAQNTGKDIEKEAARVTWVLRGYVKDTFRVVSGILISQTFYAILRQIRLMIRDTHELRMEFEEAALSFKYLLGTTAAGGMQFAHQMRYWALDTENSVAQVNDAFRQLFISGVNLQHIEGAMNIIMGTASAFRMELGELVGIMTRVAATPVVTPSTLRVLERAGIEIVPILREQLGLTMEQIENLTQLKIPGQVMFKALLHGFKDNIEAAGEFADTLRALSSDISEVIRDTIGIMFHKAYDNVRDRLRQVLRWVKHFREGVMERGPMILFNLVPQDLRKSVAYIIVSLNALGDAARRAGYILREVFGTTAAFVIQALGYILPPITYLINRLVQLAQAVLRTTPIIRVLTVVLGTLFIAYSAGAAIKYLVTWLVKLRIIQPLITGLRLLGHTFGIVTLQAGKTTVAIAILKKQLILVLLVLALIAGNFDRVRNALTKLGKAMVGEFGIFGDWEYDDHLKGIEDLNKEFEEIPEHLEDIEEAAGKAFRPFLAAFDEVYLIPEQLDSGSKALDDWEFPDLAWPDAIIPSGVEDWTSVITNLGSAFEDTFKGMGDVLDWFGKHFSGWQGALKLGLIAGILYALKAAAKAIKAYLLGKFIWPVLGRVKWQLLLWWGTIKKWIMSLPGKALIAIKAGWPKFIAWVKGLPLAIKTFLAKGMPGIWLWIKATAWPAIVGVFKGIGKAIVAVIGGWPGLILLALLALGLVFWKWGDEIVEWLQGNVVEPLKEGWSTFVEFFKEKGDEFKEWWSELPDRISEWLTDAKNTVAKFFLEDLPFALGYALGRTVGWAKKTWETITTWASDTYTDIKSWVKDTTERIKEWSIELPDRIREAVSIAYENITQWINDTYEEIKQWSIDTIAEIKQWIIDLPENIRKGLALAYLTILRWSTETWEEIKKWSRNTTQEVIQWFSALPGRIATWLNNTLQRARTWLSNMWQTARDLGRQFFNGIVDIVKTIPAEIIKWLRDIPRRIRNIGSDLWRAARTAGSNFLSGFMKGMDASSPTKVERIMDDIVKKGEGIHKELRHAFKPVEGAVRNAWTDVEDDTVSVWSRIYEGISSYLDKISDKIVDVFGGWENIAGSGGSGPRC